LSLSISHWYCRRQPPALPSFPTRRSSDLAAQRVGKPALGRRPAGARRPAGGGSRAGFHSFPSGSELLPPAAAGEQPDGGGRTGRSEEHTSELQSRFDLVCRLLLERNNSIR